MGYTTPYATLAWAEEYFSERINADNWQEADEEKKKEKSAALASASRDIERYAVFFDDDREPFKYPLDGSMETPDKLKEACCEQALYLLTVDRLGAVETTRMGIASAKGTVFDRDAIPAKLGDVCIDILKSMGARIDAAAGDGGACVIRQERLQR